MSNFHCMLDLETFDTTPWSVIRTMGAVAFDPYTGEMGAEFYRSISWKSCRKIGLRDGEDTIEFWMRQPDEARLAVIEGKSSIQEALHEFAGFYQQNCGAKKIWCHGATFDVPIVSTAYKFSGIACPYEFRDVRDTRTIFDLTDVKMSSVYPGPKHHALIDAKNQAAAVIEAYQKLKGWRAAFGKEHSYAPTTDTDILRGCVINTVAGALVIEPAAAPTMIPPATKDGF